MAVAVSGTDNENDVNVLRDRNFEEIRPEVLEAPVHERPLNGVANSATEWNHEPNFITLRGSPIRKPLNLSDDRTSELFADSSPNVHAQQQLATPLLDSAANSAVRGSEEVSETLTPLGHDNSPGKLSLNMSPENDSPLNLRVLIDCDESGSTRSDSLPLNLVEVSPRFCRCHQISKNCVWPNLHFWIICHPMRAINCARYNTDALNLFRYLTIALRINVGEISFMYSTHRESSSLSCPVNIATQQLSTASTASTRYVLF